MINPGAIPQIPGDIEALARHAQSLKQTGSAFAQTGAQVHSTWQGLAPVYQAPESGQLLTATAPVSSVSRDVGSDIEAVGGALGTYADAVRPIKARLEQLRSEASAFRSSVDGDDDWREDGDKVDQHNGLLRAVNDAVDAWMAAQRTCANAINALYGGVQWKQDNADETVEANEFGFSADVLDQALNSEQGLPWGTGEEEDRGFWGGLWDGTKGFFVDGLWGDVVGLGNLVGIGGWEKFKESWTGIGNLVGFGGWEAFKDGWVGLGKSVLAWDEWSENPARAFGQVLFNVVTLPIAFTKVTKLGVAGRAGGAANVAGDAGRVGRLTASLNKVPTVDDLAAAVKAKLPDFRMPELGPRPAYAGLPGDGPPRIPVANMDGPRAPSGPIIPDHTVDSPRAPSEPVVPDRTVDSPRAPSDPVVPPHTPDPDYVEPPLEPGWARPHDIQADPGAPDVMEFESPMGFRVPGEAPVHGLPDGMEIREPIGFQVPGQPAAPSPLPPMSAMPDGMEIREPIGFQAPGGSPDAGAGALPPLSRFPDGMDLGGPFGFETPGGGGSAHGLPEPVEFDGPLGFRDSPAGQSHGPAAGPAFGQPFRPPGGWDLTPDASHHPAGPHVPDGPRVPGQPALHLPGDAPGGGHGQTLGHHPDGAPGHGTAHTPGLDGPAARSDAASPTRGPFTPDAPETGGRTAPEHNGSGDYPAPVDDGPGYDVDGDHDGGDGPADGDGDGGQGDGHGYEPGAGDGDTTVDHHADASPSAGPGHIPPPVTDGPTLPTTEMAERFRYETDPNHPRSAFPTAVQRLSEAAREAHRVFVGDDGLIYRTDGLPFDTRGSNTHWGGPGGNDRAIFVMDEHGNLYASTYQLAGDFHHSTLANGGPVAGAGELHVVDGRLLGITDQSGHYRPGRSLTQQVAATLESYGIDMSNVYIQMMAPEGS